MKPLCIHPVQTRIFHEGESLSRFIMEQVASELVKDGIIVAVTSKIMSLAEGRLIGHDNIDKKSLVETEADQFLGEIGHGCFLTIKSGLLIPSAGIDESNSESGKYILYPKDPFASANQLALDLREGWNLEKVGVLITDSHTMPLRRGVTGICVSYSGFRAVKNMVGTRDLFGRELRMTQMNLADGLAAGAVMTMGEGAESRPVAIIENANVEFCSVDETNPGEIEIPFEEDLYYPLLKAFIKQSK